MGGIFCHDCGCEHELVVCEDCGEQAHPQRSQAERAGGGKLTFASGSSVAVGPGAAAVEHDPFYLPLGDGAALCLPCARERVVREANASGHLWAYGGTGPKGHAAVVTRSGLVISDQLCPIMYRFKGGFGDRRTRVRFRLPGIRSAEDPEGKESATVWEGTLFLDSGALFARLNKRWKQYMGHCLECLEPTEWEADVRPPETRRRPRRRPKGAAPALEL